MMRLSPYFLLGYLLFQSSSIATLAAENGAVPNVLWITSEDNSRFWLGCYGNEQAETPRMDAMAEDGVLFRHAYSNAPVCAVARCTLLHGVYSTTLGTQNMRSRHAIPDIFRPYVTYLREAGYYCTNNSKTDYNRLGNDKSIWDECSKRAHYKNRPAGSPFFAIFNLTVTHESILFPEKLARFRERGVLAQQPRLDVSEVELPPYVPDLPEVRSDWAAYHDAVTALDRQVGELLDELASYDLADDTIVFYYADHGGPTPRGKRYLQETGVGVPLLIHVPPKWRDLVPFKSGQRVDELVAFVDFAPTLLSLCKIEPPSQMQGRAFAGPYRSEPKEDEVVFLIADRFDEIIGMRRGITDGRYKYIRRFSPNLPDAPFSYYSLSMPSWTAWREAWQHNQLAENFRKIWEAPQAVEQLYDLENDPWEVNNLASSAQHQHILTRMRARLRETMTETYDTGIIPEGMFDQLAAGRTIYDFVHSGDFDYDRALEMAFLASARDEVNVPALIAALSANDPVVRYWGAKGCTILGPPAAAAAVPLTRCLSDEVPSVRIAAAQALCDVGQPAQGVQALLQELENPLSDDAALQLVNALTNVKAIDEVPQSWVDRTLAKPNGNEYVLRFARRLKERGSP